MASRMARMRSLSIGPSSSIASMSSSLNIEALSRRISRYSSACSWSSAGMSPTTMFAVVSLEDEGLHLDEVDDAAVVVLKPDRNLNHHGIVVQLLAQLIADVEGIGTGTIALVHECDAGHIVAAHLAVDSQRLGLNTGDGAEHEDRAIEHTKGALHLHGEVTAQGCQ